MLFISEVLAKGGSSALQNRVIVFDLIPTSAQAATLVTLQG
ncbi:hypothetical protein [Scytonema sp. HK-05]|nr:hypothetical protein [Scytonema sp. HK-05]